MPQYPSEQITDTICIQLIPAGTNHQVFGVSALLNLLRLRVIHAACFLHAGRYDQNTSDIIYYMTYEVCFPREK